MSASMVNVFSRPLLARAAAALLAAAAPAWPVTAQPVMQTPQEAIEQDARDYAVQSGLTPEEALQRLRFQEESVAATDRLRALYRDRLAGLFIEHRPEHAVVVLLTGKKKVPAQFIEAGGRSVPVQFRTGVKATQRQVVAAIRRHQAQIRDSLERAPAMGADPRTGELVVLVHRKDAQWQGAEALDARFEALTGVPVRIRVMDGEGGDLGLEGGARVDGVVAETGRRQYCTTGFVVTDGARTGLVTAAHCPDSLTYRDPSGGDIPLTFLGQWGWSFQDVQLHLGEAEHSPLLYADADKKVARTVTGARGRESSRVGDIVCRRGETSGYGCSEIEFTDFAPPGDLCGGPCAPTWVTVKGPCRGGDSGGPVFTGTTALGIIKGGGTRSRSGKCDYWFYMPVDFMPDGWSVLTDRGPAILPQRREERSTSRRAK
jgi:hypothetical protein